VGTVSPLVQRKRARNLDSASVGRLAFLPYLGRDGRTLCRFRKVPTKYACLSSNIAGCGDASEVLEQLNVGAGLTSASCDQSSSVPAALSHPAIQPADAWNGLGRQLARFYLQEPVVHMRVLDPDPCALRAARASPVIGLDSQPSRKTSCRTPRSTPPSTVPRPDD
jgi:hypothetical protein